MLRLKGLDHVGLLVADLERSLDFYRRLGATVLRVKEPNEKGDRLAVLQAGGQELNIVCRPGVAKAEDDGRAGMNHFCMLVDAASIEEVVAELGRAGIEIAGGPSPRRNGAGLVVRDPDGAWVELQIKNPGLSEPTP